MKIYSLFHLIKTSIIHKGIDESGRGCIDAADTAQGAMLDSIIKHFCRHFVIFGCRFVLSCLVALKISEIISRFVICNVFLERLFQFLWFGIIFLWGFTCNSLKKFMQSPIIITQSSIPTDPLTMTIATLSLTSCLPSTTDSKNTALKNFVFNEKIKELKIHFNLICLINSNKNSLKNANNFRSISCLHLERFQDGVPA